MLLQDLSKAGFYKLEFIGPKGAAAPKRRGAHVSELVDAAKCVGFEKIESVPPPK